ncbi:MAG: SPOR domain-containing protein [Ignavibacteriaceae bacterium]|jgi:tetratricopeptide (TPR) repeat protein
MIPQSIKNLVYFSLLFSAISINITAQDLNIVPYLQQIENGKADEVRNELIGLKEKYSGDPSVMFLEGVLTENGQKAVVIYQKVVDEYPDSKYADAALYRIYTYYYALGLYESANEKLNKLIADYPKSPYIKIAKQNQLPVNPEITQEDDNVVQTDITKQNNEDLKGADYKFTIQAGAFSNYENAKSLQLKFEKSGIFSEIKDKLVAGTTFHIVYVGKFITDNDAESFLMTIHDKFEISGRVIQIPQ